MPSPIGTIVPGQLLFGRYRVIRLLGRGGMGAVWLVSHIELDRERALKVISAGRDGDTQARAWFQREAKILARVSEHPNAVTVHDARLTEADVAYIDMEYIRGRSIDKILERGAPMPLDWVVRIADQLCDALQFAHDNHILHRDLKPSNLMLVDGRPPGQELLKVLDFGIGKILNAEDREGTPKTLTGAFVGTPPYTSPEQAIGEAETASDLYSVGVILYEFLTGHRPFQGVAALMIHQTLSAPPPPFREVNPKANVPAEVEALVLRCLAKRPEDRPASARALALELRTAYALATPTVIATDPPPSSPSVAPPRPNEPPGVVPPKERPRTALKGVAALLIASGLIAAGWRLWPTPRVEDSHGTAHLTGEKEPGRGSPETEGREVASAAAPPPPVGPRDVESNGHATASPLPVSIVFDPPDAEVEIGGRPTPPDDRGRVALDSGRLPAVITARGEGYETFSRTTTLGDLEKGGFRISLARAPGYEKVLADRAYRLLDGRCQRCHGVEFQGGPFDVLDRDALVGPVGDGAAPLLVPGEPGKSPLWLVAKGGHPRAEEAGRLDPGDVALLRRWIEAGAPFPGRDGRPIATAREELGAIATYLRAIPEEGRRYQRFFTFSALDRRDVSPQVRRLAAAALSKAINSLSWRAEVVIPKAVGDSGTLFALDLRDPGWAEGKAWPDVLPHYPYGVIPKAGRDEALKALAEEVEALVGAELYLFRADWFVAEATRPPLYHALLGLPDRAAELERRLKVDPRADFLEDELDRTAAEGGPYSRDPYVIDDHSTDKQVFWKAYLVHPEEGRKGIFEAPLGPPFQGNPFPLLAFPVDAGSILFSLPNNLVAFFLTDGNGNRVDEVAGPLAHDPLRTVGSSKVVDGLSCIACHRLGVKRYRDVLGARIAPVGAARAKLAKFLTRREKLDAALARQERRYLAALEAAMRPFLGPDGGGKTSVADLPEPIGLVARAYARGLDVGDVAAELGVADASVVVAALREKGRLAVREWASLAEGGTVARGWWEQEFGTLVTDLGLGTVLKIYK